MYMSRNVSEHKCTADEGLLNRNPTLTDGSVLLVYCKFRLLLKSVHLWICICVFVYLYAPICSMWCVVAVQWWMKLQLEPNFVWGKNTPSQEAAAAHNDQAIEESVFFYGREIIEQIKKL